MTIDVFQPTDDVNSGPDHQFFFTDASAATVSGHVIAVISKSLLVQDAGSLLSILTHGPGNVKK